MGQEIRGVPEATALTAESEAPAVGTYLARQRSLRGISIEDLSARTKIPRRSLERLESGAFDRASDGFTRGFVRTVATAMGLDADDAVARLLSEPPDDDAEAERSSRQLRRALALGTAATLAAALLVLAAWGARSMWPAETPAAASLFYRRDAVRELAEAVAIQDAPALASLPAAPRDDESP